MICLLLLYSFWLDAKNNVHSFLIKCIVYIVGCFILSAAKIGVPKNRCFDFIDEVNQKISVKEFIL